MKRSGFVVVVLACLLCTGARADLTIHCLDVGQGDATLIQSSSGQTLLFDAGNNGKGSGIVNPYLAGLGISDLDYAIASHYHSDHVGGLDEVISGTGVSIACYDRGWSYTTLTYQSYANAAGGLRRSIEDGQVIDLGDGVTVRCMALNGNGTLYEPFEQPPFDENDLCVAVVVSCGDFDFFVAGDLVGSNASGYRDVETSVGAEVGDIEIYRVDHHGSRYSSNATFLGDLAPEVSIISVGSNSYGHPSQEVIDRLVAADSYIYQTEVGSGGTIPSGCGTIVGGHVVIHTDGMSYFTVDDDLYPLTGSAACPDEGCLASDPSLILEARPNPFSRTTTIHYATSGPQQPGTILLLDLSGRQVRRWQIAGSGEVAWDGRDAGGRELPSGFYFIRTTGLGPNIPHRVLLAR